MQINFDDTFETLYLRIGKYIENTFIPTRTTTAIAYSLIAGIQLVNSVNMKSPYKTGRQV